AMAVYAVVMTIGFMIAFPLVEGIVKESGWRVAWAGIGWVLVLVLAPFSVLLVRRSPEALGLNVEGDPEREDDSTALAGYTLGEALGTAAFWVMATASALYGLIASGIGLFNESVLKVRGFDAGVY